MHCMRNVYGLTRSCLGRAQSDLRSEINDRLARLTGAKPAPAKAAAKAVLAVHSMGRAQMASAAQPSAATTLPAPAAAQAPAADDTATG